MTPPDGDWWRKVQLHCAARDGDEAAVATMRQDEERARAKWRAAGNALLRKFNPGMTAALLKAVAEQLPLAAGELRELALENDPDAMRDGLIELATKGVGRAVPLTVVEANHATGRQCLRAIGCQPPVGVTLASLKRPGAFEIGDLSLLGGNLKKIEPFEIRRRPARSSSRSAELESRFRQAIQPTSIDRALAKPSVLSVGTRILNYGALPPTPTSYTLQAAVLHYTPTSRRTRGSSPASTHGGSSRCATAGSRWATHFSICRT
jgi:hypothetical protein